ncbi:hypothetical protein DL764_006064 [Monosporascus ibericus]|uniref:Tc1-like transposase DDE domain-containing protein n=1 Tax=Monosporascus ibericus TaxID=155417 RepID=A0A4Q4T7Y8_9PEZI|nr:hypothetical protein DL764_006064 [Monosporascus ibericus]
MNAANSTARAKVRGAKELNDTLNVGASNRQIFRIFGVPETTDFLARLVSEDKIHFGFRKEGRDNVKRKAEDYNAWWTVAESNATMDRGQRRQEQRLQQQLHYDPPLKHYEQKACHAVGLMTVDGWRSPLFWYEWLQQKGYIAIQNVHDSPETNPIESTIKKVKSHVANNPHINTRQLMRLAEEGWDMINKERQKAIFKSMVQRWKDVIRGGGQRIAH